MSRDKILSQDKKKLVGKRKKGTFKLTKEWVNFTSSSIGFDYKKEDVALLYLSLLYSSGTITQDKLKGLLKSLKKGTLMTYKHNYNAKKINGVWYNCERMEDILKDMVPENVSTTVEEFIKVLNLYFNANRNYCINYIYVRYFKNLIEYHEEHYDLLNEILGSEFISYKKADWLYDLSDGYCCYDCDGCLSEYKRNRYNRLYKPDKTETDKKVRLYLTDLKNPTTKHTLSIL